MLFARERIVTVLPSSENVTGRSRPIRVTRFERHPDFDAESALAHTETADVALLKLAEPLAAPSAPAPLGSRDYFLIGDRFDGKLEAEGKLYLIIGPSPWNCASTGTYDVKISRKGD